jgi:Zn-dependent protease
MAIRKGDRTPIESGHMTLNPIVHMGIPSLIVFALAGIAWGQMPINPYRLRGKYAGVLVAASGPAMNLLLAALCIVAAGLWLRFGANVDQVVNGTADSPLVENLFMFLSLGAMLNVVLAILNLMPVPPLDGSKILGGLSLRMGQLYSHPNAGVIGMFILIAVFFISPMGDVIFSAASQWTLRMIILLAGG